MTGQKTSPWSKTNDWLARWSFVLPFTSSLSFLVLVLSFIHVDAYRSSGKLLFTL